MKRGRHTAGPHLAPVATANGGGGVFVLFPIFGVMEAAIGLFAALTASELSKNKAGLSQRQLGRVDHAGRGGLGEDHGGAKGQSCPPCRVGGEGGPVSIGPPGWWRYRANCPEPGWLGSSSRYASSKSVGTNPNAK